MGDLRMMHLPLMRRQAVTGSLGLLLGMGMLISAGCAPSNGDGSRAADVQIDGSSTVYPISEAVAEELRTAHPDISVTVAKSGTGGGMKKFAKGETDISDASREIKESEAEACAENGIEYDHFMVAYDGIAVCVNPENDWCDSLTVEQLKELFRLDSPIKKWKDLNDAWPDEEINLFGPGADSGTFDSFNEQVLGKETKSRTGYTQSEEDNVLVNGVKMDKYALGYFGFAYYVENADVLKVLAVDSGDGTPVTPTEQTIRSKTYTPLSRPLFIYVNKKSFMRPKVQTFVEFYLDHAAEMATEVGYVAVDQEEAAANQKKLEELKAATPGA